MKRFTNRATLKRDALPHTIVYMKPIGQRAL